MTNVVLRLAALAAAVVLVRVPAAAQEALPSALPWGINAEQVSAQLEAKELRVVHRRPGREVHAASQNRLTQAIAILTNDSLVGLIYFHPENAQHNAPDLFTLAASQAERAHGPPLCRNSALAVWTLEQGILEVRLRRAVGDAAPGAEIRYIGPGYAEEMARRTAPRPAARPAPAPARRNGPRLLGTVADSVQQPPVEPAPVPTVEAAPTAPPAPPAPTPAYCASAA
ncbi:hypothetical protein [Longimicrobium sp.]|uniref:hypothetical protein n=1 Tax=Longimicrobium sp. TaxID=2029185 RepID=UPI002E34E361|nr:hypothetical protein [Longimicrobium sp.]HEX6038032.1 hypothetical protein [Longimicrobium sp.]